MKFLIRIFHAIAIICLTAYLSYPQILTIHHIDVGQGDATLIRARHGKTVLIDAGSRGKGNNVVLPYLTDIGITSLDLVIASHYHADHIGGFDEVLQAFSTDSVRLVIDRGNNPPLPSTESFSKYWVIANQNPYHSAVTPGQTFALGNNVTLQCLAADGTVLGYGAVPDSRSDENNLSLAWILSTEKIVDGRKYVFRYFTGGDCGGISEKYADLETPIASIVGDVDVMKINHHGSRYSTNSVFLDSLRPEAVIISVGNNNRYGHPAFVTINRLDHSHSIRSIYQTQCGNISAKAWKKVKVVGTVQIAVFDSFYTIGPDTYAIGYQEHKPKKANTLLMSTTKDTSVTILIYNILGKVVGTIKNRPQDEGEYRSSLERENLPPGLYFISFESSSGKLLRKVIYIY